MTGCGAEKPSDKGNQAYRTLDEIKENDYNLNISSYIDTTEEEEQIDVAQAIQELKQLELERNEIEATMYSFLKELGYCE